MMTRLLLLSSCFFILSPAASQISVQGSLAQDHDALPGDVYVGEIVILNSTGEPTQARIYQTDYLFFDDGSNYFEDPGTTPRSNASWIQFNPSSITLSPHRSEVVQYVVTVPESVEGSPPLGSFWSMLMVEGIPKESPQSTLGAANEATFGIRQVTRYGVQVASHIREHASYSIEISRVDLRQDETGSKFLELSFVNNGSLLLVPETWVELYDDNGTLANRVPGSESRVYPGTSVAHRFDLNGTPSGSYDALIVVDGGGENIFGAQYKVRL